MKKILTVILLLVAIVTKTPHAWAKSPPGNENTNIILKKEVPPVSIGNASYDPVNQDNANILLGTILKRANIQRARPGPIIGNINFTTISDGSSNIAACLKKEKITWSAANPAITGNNSMPIPAD